MKSLIILLLSSIALQALSINSERLANAINRVENSKKYPYGIKSIDTHRDSVLARKICLNTIRNNYQRWNKSGNFIEFLSKAYAPISASKLNKNWVKNVIYFYAKTN